MGDTGNALLAAIAITSALYHRERTGHGQAVSTSIVNAQLLLASHTWIHADGRQGTPDLLDKDQYGLSPFYRLYECADERWLCLAAVKAEHRIALAGLLRVDPGTFEQAEKATAFLEAHFRERPSAFWGKALDESEVPAELVNEQFCREIFDDAEARALELVSETRVGGVGRFEDLGLFVQFSATPGIVRRGPCLCGEHTREIMLEHGYTGGDVDALVADRAALDAGSAA
jgi:crotonobetainyl-CoA:carnitine CoA-transferase CaiB-like acyl-CoA transferase